MADESDPCAAERSACDQTDCKALLLCVQGCLDAACIEDCQSSEVSSQAHSQLRELQECVRDSGQRARSAPAAAQGKDGATQRPVTRERARMARNRGGAGTVGAQRSGAAPPGDDGATESAVAKLARAMRSTASQLHQDAALASQEQIPASEVGSAKTLARRRAAAKARQHRRLRVRHRGHLRSFMRGAAAAAWGERQQQGGEQDEGEEDDSYDPELDGPEEGEEQGEEQGGQGGGDQDQGSGADEGAEGSGSDYDPELDDPPEGGEEDESDLPPVFSRADDLRRCTGCQLMWQELHRMLANRERLHQQKFDLAINSVCTLGIPDAEEVCNVVVEDAEGAFDLYSKGATPTQACTEYELCTEEVVRLAQQQLAR